MNEIKNWFFEKTNKIGKSLAKFIKNKREPLISSNMERNKREPLMKEKLQLTPHRY